MGLWKELPCGKNPPEDINVVVEILKGGRQRFNLEGDHPVLEGVFSALAYPTDCGFVPRTCWDSGRPIESLVLVDEPTFPGCVIPARPVGVLKILGADEKRSDKILSVPLGDPKYEKVFSARDLSPHIQEELFHFFTTFREALGGRTTFEIIGWGDENEAKKVIMHGTKVFRRKVLSEAAGSEELEDEYSENV
ncbi:MAG: inorganic diphosphatase [archaeon]